MDVVDAVGAGDGFTAAVINGLIRNWSLPDTARVANGVGALVASQRGAMPDLRDRLVQLVGAGVDNV